jgi:hypothetical protein
VGEGINKGVNMAASAIPKIWMVCTKDELRVVRCSAAGVVLSDATISPTLFDHATAKEVMDQLGGILSAGGIPVSLMIKPKSEARA